ncbi:hypothetical protein BN946_scf184845.g37 [Trametes cinnabarina]|uniref:Spermatogenesis-associated protein 20-like TRX domain-containing protein n=1 Tax=Pycnoporus cinnabarinus TaxID=5643 RepID=A0A060S9J0_PYCCI|nr:hypothetical protein BN946_scf184845.g37 [Trametes cinnabarina]
MSTSSLSARHLNRLAKAKSPYLLQHAENPVDWFEWGPEAFDKAKRENKPIFLSVGYSACHWCHVLAHESFEDEVTAKIMNEHYVNIKVDREERPDVDRLYMTFLQATTGGGGWPMSVWLTPDLHPFFAGTYFPPGQFRQILLKLAEVWETDSERCINSGKQVIEAIRESSNIAPEHDINIKPLASEVFQRLQKRFDSVNGGFDRAPKFPSPAQTTHFLSRYAALHLSNTNASDEEKKNARAARDMAVYTMIKIYNGGIHDFVGGGFSRYSVDERWHVPHSQLLTSALELYQLLPASSSDKKMLERMAKDIVTYVSNNLRSPQGGFYSAEDADSLPSHDSTVKKEGAFYVWTAQQIDELLGADAELFKYHFGVKAEGNCDPSHDIQGELKGQNVLYVAHSPEETGQKYGKSADEVEKILEANLMILRDFRDKHRPRPHLDDKILTCWNGLMISGLSRTHAVLQDDEGIASKALELAEASASFLRAHLYDEQSGELRRSYREGQGPAGQADDYAFLIQGLLDLYEASAKEEYLTWAIRLQEKQDELFYDSKDGGYFASAPDEHILIRMKDAQDGAEPSAASITLSNLQRLAHFAEDKYADYNEKAKSILASNGQLLSRAPYALASMVSAALLADRGYMQLIHTGTSPESNLLKLIRSVFIPNRVLIHLDPGNPPRELVMMNSSVRSLVEELGKGGARTKENVRICENFTCGLPIEDGEELKKRLPSIPEVCDKTALAMAMHVPERTMSSLRIMPEQGRAGLNGLPPIDNAWVAPDPDARVDVYLVVYPPRPRECDPRGLHWSISWEVARGAWRIVHLEMVNDYRAPPPQPRYVYWGPQTKTGGLATKQATKILIRQMSLQTRRDIEAISRTIPVMAPNGQWNCQQWTIALLGKLLERKIIDQRTWDRVVAETHRGEPLKEHRAIEILRG